MTYFLHTLILIIIYALLAMSLDLVLGFAGLLSMCHAAFFGIGAYSTALLTLHAGMGFLPAMVCATVITAALSLVVALPAMRLRGDYFVLATLGFQVIVFTVLYNWTEFTRGSFGIPGIPSPKAFGWSVDGVGEYLAFSGAVATVLGAVLWGLARSPFGRVLQAVREDEVAAAAIGKNVPWLRTAVFAIGAGAAAVPGALFAGYFRFIDPTSFTLMESIFILAIVVIGGAGSLWGSVLGAVLMVWMPEALRFLQVPESLAGGLKQAIYGLLLVVMMRFRPRGFIGAFSLR